MKNKLRDWFTFSKPERVGILSLFVIIIVVFSFTEILPRISSDEIHVDETLFEVQKVPTKKELSIIPFKVDTMSNDDWVAFGLPDSIIEKIENYQIENGEINHPSQFYKIDGIPKKIQYLLAENIHVTTYEKLNNKEERGYENEKYFSIYLGKGKLTIDELEGEFYLETNSNVSTLIGKSKDSERLFSLLRKVKYEGNDSAVIVQVQKNQIINRLKEKELIEEKKDELIININLSNEEDWKKLRGIGEVLSERIVKYREKLGGFNSINQLKEVYGLSEDTFNKIKAHLLKEENNDLIRLNINEASIDQLKSHPYIKWNVANSIVSYRETHGKYSSIDEIKQSDLIDDELYVKIAPYLTIE